MHVPPRRAERVHDAMPARRLLYYAPCGIALEGHLRLAVLGTQQQAVAVVGETAGAPVVVAFLQHIARPVQLVVRLPSARAYHACHPACSVAQVFSFQAVETRLLHHLAQSVEPEGVAFAAFVDDLAQLQLAVVSESHVAAELPPARERAQRAVVELHVVQHVRGPDEVARGVVREVVHVAVRLLDAYQVAGVVVGVGRDVPKHVARPHHAPAAVVPPVAVQSVREGEPYQLVPRIVRQCEGTPFAVGDARQVAPLVGVGITLTAGKRALHHAVALVVFPCRAPAFGRRHRGEVAPCIVGVTRLAAVLVRRQHGQAEFVEGGAAAVAFGVYRHVQFLELVVVLSGHAPVGVHYLIYQLVLAMEVFGGVSQTVGGAGYPLAVFDAVFHHPAVAPRVDAAGRLAPTVVFPMETHARLVGEFHQLVSLVAETFHRSQRILRGCHVARLVVAVAHKQGVLAVGSRSSLCTPPVMYIKNPVPVYSSSSNSHGNLCDLSFPSNPNRQVFLDF